MTNFGDQLPSERVRPVVIVIGNFSHEGLTAKIESLGFDVINRNLRSKARNWSKIIELMNDLSAQGLLAAVFLYLPTTTLLQASNPEYDEVRPLILHQISRIPSIVFVHEDNLQGTIEPFPWEVRGSGENDEDSDAPWPTTNLDYGFRGEFGLLTINEWKEKHASAIERAIELLADLHKRNIEVAPFRKRSDVTIRMFEALEESQAGIFLRLYVPHGRYQSEQFEDFLTLFSRYLREVEGREFSVDSSRTSKGTTYIFKGRGEASTIDDLQAATKRFDDFLLMAQLNPQSAAQILERSGIEPAAAQFLVAKYSRSMKRLQLDIRHEYERRKLILSQSLESELIEDDMKGLLPVPDSSKPSSILSVVGNAGPVTININSNSVVASGNAAIDRLIVGDVSYTSEDRKIIELMEGISDKLLAMQLRSDLDRLKDPSTSPEQQRTAVQKLKGFLYSATQYVGKKIDEVGTKILIAYLDNLLKDG